MVKRNGERTRTAQHKRGCLAANAIFPPCGLAVGVRPGLRSVTYDDAVDDECVDDVDDGGSVCVWVSGIHAAINVAEKFVVAGEFASSVGT